MGGAAENAGWGGGGGISRVAFWRLVMMPENNEKPPVIVHNRQYRVKYGNRYQIRNLPIPFGARDRRFVATTHVGVFPELVKSVPQPATQHER